MLWVYHLMDVRDAQGRAVRRATVSQTELARLTRSINLQLEIVQDGARRGVKVVWARRGRDGMTIWDEAAPGVGGSWASMPERIEEAVYAGLSEADRERIEQELPDVFPNPETAIAWGLEQGAFKALQHARNAYEKLRREEQPQDARAMARLWVADVQARVIAANGNGNDGVSFV